MMPEFARGWEKDGWEADVDWVRKAFCPFPAGGHRYIATISDRGWLMIQQFYWHGGSHNQPPELVPDESIEFEYKDPLTAKKRAETLMEGL